MPDTIGRTAANREMTQPTGTRTRRSRGRSSTHFIYVTEVDLSLDNGHGINEREFVDALTTHFPDEVSCIAPGPLHPETYANPLVRYASQHGGRAWGYPGFLVSAARMIRRLATERRVDAVAFRFGVTPLLPYAFARWSRLPIMLKTLAPNAALGAPVAGRKLQRFFSRLLRPAYRRVVRSALAADTVSVPYRAWINDRYDIALDRVAIITNGANTEIFRPGDRRAARRRLGLDGFDALIGYVGTLGKIRHVDRVIRALSRVRHNGRVGLVLVGGGDERQQLEKLVVDEGLDGAVLFVGKIPYATVPEYMRAFDVAVDPTSVEMEIGDRALLSSFSQKIPQYLASGVPVVAWRCADTEFLEAQGVGGVATFGDEEELAAVIDNLLSLDGAARSQASARARRVGVERFSAAKLAAERIDWWRSVVTGQWPERSPVSGKP